MRVAVLGGGLQGACVAMELASPGISVDIFDKNEQCLSQASMHNEGKIHLGFVYANDRSRRTARLMIQGALRFSPLMQKWLGRGSSAFTVSTPFHYVVHRDSLISSEEFHGHLWATHAIAAEQSQHIGTDYFGEDYLQVPRRLTPKECRQQFDDQTVLAAFQTPEISIDPERLSSLVRERISSDPHIHCRLQTLVRGVSQDDQQLNVNFENEGISGSEQYDHVVNCLWDGRLQVDQTVGLKPQRPWMYRVKYFLRGRSADGETLLPSTTIVLGAFGDVVSYPDGGFYLSWYPAGMCGKSTEISPPNWPSSMTGSQAESMRQSIREGLTQILPGLEQVPKQTIDSSKVNGGIIFAWGTTDVDDRQSGLHERYEVGPRSQGRYHTIDTGKLTTAPLFGKQISERIREMGTRWLAKAG